LHIQGIYVIVNFFHISTLAFCKSSLTISEPSIIARTDNFKEGEFTILVPRAAKKVSMLIVYLGGQHNYHFVISPTLALHESVLIISISSKIAEKDTFK